MRQSIIICLTFISGLYLMGFQDELAASKKRGEEIYENYCIACHSGQGEGVPGVYPPLAKSDYLMEQPEKAAAAVKYGQEGEIVVNGETYNNYMASLGLSDQEVADVLNYIMNSWGNTFDHFITAEDVAKIEEPKK